MNFILYYSIHKILSYRKGLRDLHAISTQTLRIPKPKTHQRCHFPKHAANLDFSLSATVTPRNIYRLFRPLAALTHRSCGCHLSDSFREPNRYSQHGRRKFVRRKSPKIATIRPPNCPNAMPPGGPRHRPSGLNSFVPPDDGRIGAKQCKPVC